jgi:hypothetical protein
MKKLIIFIIILTTLISCGDDNLKNVTFSGYVYEEESGNPLEGVEVNIEEFASVLTDAEGYYYIKKDVYCIHGINIDVYKFGFEGGMYNTICDTNKISHDFYLLHGKATSPPFRGTVYKKEDSTPLEGAILYFSNVEIVGSPNEVTTDENGKFEDLQDYIDWVEDLYIHAEKSGRKNYSKKLEIEDDWGYPGLEIYLELE